VVNFKKGVYYKGRIIIESSGTAENKIVFEGAPDWGSGDSAIIDQRTSISMTQCPDADTCGGNVDYTNMYYGTIPDAANDHRLMVFEGDSELYFATYPAMSNPWYYTQVEDMNTLASGVTSTSITDARFNQSDSNYWVGSWVVVWLAGNSLGYGQVYLFNPDNDTITYSSVGTPLEYEGNYYYSIFNNAKLISQAGYYAIDSISHKVYLWPNVSADNISHGSISGGGCAFWSNSQNYHTIQHFEIIGSACPLGVGSGPTDGILFDNNTVISTEGFDGSGAISVKGNGIAANYITNNIISYVRGTRGIWISGDKNYVQNNTMSNINGTIIYSSGGDVQVISDNVISDSSGTHANGISTYGSSVAGVCTPNTSLGVQVYNNRLTGVSGYNYTFECAQEILAYNNVFGGPLAVAHWGNDEGDFAEGSYLKFYNNTMIGTITPTHLHMFDDVEFVGNIMRSNDCTLIETHIYNMYYLNGGCSSLSTGEYYGNLDDTLVDYVNGNYTLRAASPAIGAIPSESAPTSVFTTDILGTTRGSSWDIGAYEYVTQSTTQFTGSLGGSLH
jgi:hypothetical protein